MDQNTESTSRALTLADNIADAIAANAFRGRGQEDVAPDTLLAPLLKRLAATEAGEVSFLLASLAAGNLGELDQLRAVVESAADWTGERTGATDREVRAAAKEACGQLIAAASALATARDHLDAAAATIQHSLPDAPAPALAPVPLPTRTPDPDPAQQPPTFTARSGWPAIPRVDVPDAEIKGPRYYSSIGEAAGAAMQHNIELAHRTPRLLLPEPELPVTEEYVRLAAAAICARAMHRLAHPSGTDEALVGQSIVSTQATASPQVWSDLPPNVFRYLADQVHHLISRAADHTYLATAPQSSAASVGAPRHWQVLVPDVHSRWVTGADVRHEAVSLAQALIEDDVRNGMVFGPLLHTPIEGRHTPDGRPTSWSRLPVRHLAPTLRAVELSVREAHRRIHIAVDAAVLDVVPQRERTAAALSRTTPGHTPVPTPAPAAVPTDPGARRTPGR